MKVRPFRRPGLEPFLQNESRGHTGGRFLIDLI